MTSETECRHHWLIERPNGLASSARCKFCGAEREFDNVSPWEKARAKKLTRPESVDLHRSLLSSSPARTGGEYVE
jgi:hypothetical protein